MRSAADIIKRVDKLASDRTTWESHWQECADYCLPRKAQITTTKQPGEKNTTDLYDSTAIYALEKFAAGMFSYLCPPGKRWFALGPRDKELLDDDEVKRWFMDVTRLLAQAINGSNYPLQAHEMFIDLGCVGTTCMYVELNDDGGVNFRNRHITQFFILESNKGLVDSVFCRYSLTARQAVQEYGPEVGEKVQKAADDPQKCDTQFTFIHAVFPREEREPGKRDAENMPIASIHVNVEDKRIVRESGFEEMPYMATRFLKGSNEVYGRSPAMASLPEIKMVNQQRRTVIVAAQRVVDPPWLVPNDGSVSRVRNTPGALMYFDAARPENKPEPLQTGAQIGMGMDMIEDTRRMIHTGFYADLFAMLQQQDETMTATEVMARLEERLNIFAPTFGRLTGEFFDPMIQRVFGLLMRAGRLPAPPAALADNPEYEIVYVSKLALAIQLMEMKAFGDFMGFLAPYFQLNPEIADNFDLDEVAQIGAERFGVPTEFLRAKKQRDAIRKARAEQQAAQQQAALAMEAAKSVDMSKRPEEGSPMQVLGGMASG